MYQINLFGQPSASYNHLKKSLQDYIEAGKINCEVCEHEELYQAANQSPETTSVIEFMGHTLEFRNGTDFSIKLSKLFLLLESAQSPSSNKKKCINCDRCRCQKTLDSTT